MSTIGRAVFAAIAKPIAVFVGRKVLGVEDAIDNTYQNFYITACEVVNRNNTNPEQRTLLDNDDDFRAQKCYLVTAVRHNDEGLIQRRFIIHEWHMHTLELQGIKKPTVEEKTGDQRSVILGESVSFPAIGQYLENLWGVEIAKLFPRVHGDIIFEGILEGIDEDEIREINDLLKANGVSKSPRVASRFGGGPSF